MAAPALDIEDHTQLLAYLRATERIGSSETPAFRTLGGGVSNRAVRVDRPNGEGWVMKQALGKLRVKVDWFSDPARIEREAMALRVLPTLVWPGAVTPLVFEDRDEHILAMQAVPEPHENWKTLLLAGEVNSELITQFGRLLGTIHSASRKREAELSPLFADRRFFETLRVEPYYTYTATQVPAAATFIGKLVCESDLRRLTLVHGDYSPKNILVRNQMLVLLDHEVIHWGDPAFDVGFALTHLLSKAHHLPEHRDKFAAAAVTFWVAYRQSMGMDAWAADLDEWATRHAMACLLARAAGRSPLEYLDEPARTRQVAAAVSMLADPPRSVADLAALFVERINKHGDD